MNTDPTVVWDVAINLIIWGGLSGVVIFLLAHAIDRFLDK